MENQINQKGEVMIDTIQLKEELRNGNNFRLFMTGESPNPEEELDRKQRRILGLDLLSDEALDLALDILDKPRSWRMMAPKAWGKPKPRTSKTQCIEYLRSQGYTLPKAKFIYAELICYIKFCMD